MLRKEVEDGGLVELNAASGGKPLNDHALLIYSGSINGDPINTGTWRISNTSVKYYD